MTTVDPGMMAEGNHFTAEEVKDFVGRSVKPLFVYGSLLVPAIVAHLVDNLDCPVDEDKIQSPTTAATLTGFRRFSRKNSIFPAVLDGFPASSVKGLVLFGLTSSQRGRIDGFEGGVYSRETNDVKIILASGKEEIIDADVYVWARGRSELQEFEEHTWSLDEFLKTDFCKQYLSRVSSGA